MLLSFAVLVRSQVAILTDQAHVMLAFAVERMSFFCCNRLYAAWHTCDCLVIYTAAFIIMSSASVSSQWRNLFSTLLQTWRDDVAALPRRNQIAFADALVCDCQTLLAQRPQGGPDVLVNPALRGKFWDLIRVSCSFLKREVLCHAQELLPKHRSEHSRVTIIAPFTGGVSLQSNNNCSTSHVDSFHNFSFGCLNPGNSGLSGLFSREILWWKLLDCASFCRELNIKLLVLPGPRMPAGFQLPPDYPFLYVGARNQSWNTVGVLLARDIATRVEVLENASTSDRRIWLRIPPFQSYSPLILCAFYAPPNSGDKETFFRDLINEARALKQTMSNSGAIILVGDSNTHLSCIADHTAACRCLHCRQPREEAAIERCLQNSGFNCQNPINTPTHCSGTSIDLVLTTDSACLRSVKVFPVGQFLNSDHSLVLGDLAISVQSSPQPCIGRVGWLPDEKWHDIMQVIDSCMDLIAELVEAVSRDPSLSCSPPVCSLKQRRSCLDACDWLRVFAFVTAGHLGGVVKASLPAAAARVECPSDTASIRAKQHGNWARYVHLRDTNPSEAAKFLAKLLRPSIATQIRLKHESTGELLSTGEALTAILDDITSRPLSTKVLVTDSTSSSQKVSAIRALGATVDPSTDAVLVDDWCPYTMDEIDLCIQSLDPSKYTFRGCYASLLHAGTGTRRFICALLNLALQLQICASSWCERIYNPIRKKGPTVVVSLQCLRPISQGTEMAALVDALFLLRHRRKLEHFWGSCQGGGRAETLSFALALLLFCQLRRACQLPTIINFADLWAGFDTIPTCDILLGAFHAGIVGKAWMQLDDELRLDRCRVRLDHAISAPFTVVDGVAQGKKASVHKFNTAATVIKDYISQHILGAAIPTGTWQHRVLQHAEYIKPAIHGHHNAALGPSPLPKMFVERGSLCAALQVR